MILSHDALNRERDWFESSQSLLYGGVSDYENTEKAVRELLFTLIRETFLIGICWLTQMYTFLTDHFANHVKSALLNTKFSHLEDHVKFLSLVDLEYHTVTRKFIRNAVTAIIHARYAKMVYAVHNVSGTLKNLVGSFSPMNMITENNNNNDSNSLGSKVLQVAQDAIPKLATGVNPVTAIATSAITTVTGHKSPLDLIYATGKFLTSDRDPQTVNYLPQTCNKVSELYTAVRGQLLNDITTNFFANLVLEIQQYKSISIENSLQNRLNRMSDKDIAYMANIEIESSRQKVLNNHETIKRLEQARDSIEDVIALLNNKNIENNIFNMNNDSNNIKKRIRATHEDTQVSIDSNQDEDKSDDETSKFEDEHELMRYDDKTSNLELGFLNGDSLKSDVKFVEQRQQQQPTLITTMASNVRMIADGFEQISSLPISINSILQQREDTSSYIVSDDEEDRNSVIENPINKKGSFLIH
ncbi:unnamed protein product [Rotaria sordida]|uniref:Uncharacterized protein n=1 Tax=Rotaria sordida TaxID=392033 RepID=A0A815H4Q1_9BILA|nr:unnamed protein product [Rotaria sordida]